MARTQHEHAKHPSVVALGVNLYKLNESDHKFASDLVTKAARWGASTKQMEWIERLLARANGSEKATQRKTADIGDMSGINTLFANAQASRLRFPAIILRAPDGADLKLSVAGQTAQVPGSINVVSIGDGDDRVWLGRIKADGVFEQSLKNSASPSVIHTLQRFAGEPARVAAEHGRLTGRCCFCNRALTDPASTERGYGPVCAKRFGVHVH